MKAKNYPIQLRNNQVQNFLDQILTSPFHNYWIKKRVLLNPPTTNPPTTNQQITDHLLTDPPTHRSNNHRPNRQDSTSKASSMKNIHFTERKQLERCKTILRSIIYLMNRYLYKISIYLHKTFIFSFLQKKTTFL